MNRLPKLSRILGSATTVGTLFIGAACTDDRSGELPLVPSFEEQSQPTDDCGGQCTYSEGPISGTTNFALGTSENGAGLSLWHGQDPVAGPENGVYECPPYVSNPHFYWNGHHFHGWTMSKSAGGRSSHVILARVWRPQLSDLL